MKLLAITLALAIFAGSPVSVLSDEPVSQMDQLRQSLFEYFRDINRIYEQQRDLLRQSDVVQAVEDQASESFSNISRRFRKLGEEMPREVKDTLDVAVGIPTGVAEKIFDALRDFSRRLEPATGDFYQALEPILAARARPALEKVRPYATMVRTRIQEMGQNQTEKLRVKLGQLEALGPEIKRVLQRIEEIQVSLQPLADELQGLLRQKMEGAVSAAKPYVSPVLKAAEEYTADLKKWVARPLFPREQEENPKPTS